MKNKIIKFSKQHRRSLIRAALAFAAFVMIAIYCTWQNNALTVSKYTFASDEMGEELNGYKIVQVSDLHNKEFGNDSETLLSLISRQQPDIIVITGDLVDSRRTNVNIALNFVRGAVKIAPVYYITGNNEISLADDTLNNLLAEMESEGVILMDNKSKKITVGETSFNLIGLSDKYLMGNTLGQLISNDNELNILLAHEPQIFDNYTKYGADLILSGHAHGGQIRLPFVGGLFAPGQGFFPEYTEGIHEVGDGSRLVISRGLGNSVFPLRINNRPELVVVELQGK